jgi:hypothetical protein
MRSVSNWDFQNGVVPSALTANSGSTSVSSTSTMTLAGLEGSLANRSNFYVTISNTSGGNVRYAVVSSANAAGNTLTLAPTPTSASPSSSPPAPALSWVAGERVELAAGLGAPLALDFNNNALADTTAERVNFNVSSAVNKPGSARINGGMAVAGYSFLQYLRAPRQASATDAAGTIKVSGLVAVNSTSVPTVAGVLQNGAPTGNRTLVNSNAADFPFAGAETPDQKFSIVEDGLNRIANSPQPARQVQPFTPPDISQGGSGFGRYRQMTKYSQPAVSGDPPQAGAYGYGQGIYINNPQDKEKIGAPTYTSSQEMSQAQLEELWFDPSVPGNTDFTKSHLRAGPPRPANVSDVSLEQQHLRGWIAPDEFLPRGALVEINPDATITVTLDSIEDGAGTIPGTSERYNEGPVPTKGWRDANGNLINGTLGGKYSRTVNWPENGVIFAEGNIRIRGKASTTNPARNLTVVSMNNIYVEDSLGAGDKKVLLLARRNVVANPTRIMGRPQAQTRAGAGSSGTTIAVRDTGLFHVGDRIQIGSGATYRRVTNVGATTLTVNSAPGTTPTDGTTVIALQTDPTNSTGTRPFFGAQTPYLRAETQAMPRRFWLGGTSAIRVAMRHAGAESPAIEVETTGTPPTLRLGNKITTPPNAPPAPLQITSAEKNLTVENDPYSPYPSTPATDTIDQLVADMNSGATTLTDGWQYNASAIGGYGITPYRYLAGAGLRYKIDPTVAPTAFASREDVSTATKEFTMATSVRVSVNDGEAVLQLEDGSGGYLGFAQFGFSPLFNGFEDALTIDRTFYTAFTSTSSGTNPLFAYLTTDSRYIANNLIANNMNTLTWRFHETVAGAGSPEDGFFSETGNRRLPYYALGRVKLENLDQYNTTNAFETLDAGYTMDINAYVYAQEGGWFIIPGVYFDERLKTSPSGISFVDLNNNFATTPEPEIGEYYDANGSGSADAGEGLDFNRDGVITRAEEVGLFRFLRYNYSIKFTGAIMENKTALIEDPDGTGPLRGPASDWTDKWAKVTTNSSNFTGTAPTDTFVSNTMTTANGNFATIEYNYDSDAALEALITQTGFNPPISPDLIYQSG